MKKQKRSMSAILLILMMGLAACGSSDGTKKLAVEDLQNIYQTVGIQAIDEMAEGVTFADPAWENEMSKEGTYVELCEKLNVKITDSSPSIYVALYGLGFDEKEAASKVESYREYLNSQGYEENFPAVDEWRIWDGVFVKEDVAIILWSSGGNILPEDDNDERAVIGQESFRLEIIPIK